MSELLTPEEQTRALMDIPFADLRSQQTRDVLCKAQRAKSKEHYEPQITELRQKLIELEEKVEYWNSSKLREKIAELEHEQWVQWSKAVAEEVSPERKVRWEKLWIPYDELTEEQKDQDRIWADKALALLKGEK